MVWYGNFATYCTSGPSEESKPQMPSGSKSNEAFCLTLPGNQLDLSALLKDKKFRHRGNKEGALQTMKILEEDKLGKLEEKQTKGSVKVGLDNSLYYMPRHMYYSIKTQCTCQPL